MYFFSIVYEAVKILAVLIDKAHERFRKIAETFTKKEQKLEFCIGIFPNRHRKELQEQIKIKKR